MRDLEFIDFLNAPQMDYESIWEFQKKRVDAIAGGAAKESVIFCEHERLITKGRRFNEGNILDTSLPTFEIERGGDVTYHGPGQLVIYPLVKLNGPIFKQGLHEYLRFCEQVIINVLKGFDLEADRFGPTGVWVKTDEGMVKKIASIGVAVRRWVTYHGMALNVSSDLSDFGKIRPCDFDSSVMTSLKELEIEISLQEVSNLIRAEILKNLAPTEKEVAPKAASLHS